MKKLMIMALGLGIALGSVSFAQDSSSGDSTKMDKKAKKTKKSKKKSDTTEGSTTSKP